MGGVVKINLLGVGYGDKYGIAFAPITGGQKVTSPLSIEIDCEQINGTASDSADWGNAGLQLVFCDDAFNKYYYFISCFRSPEDSEDGTDVFTEFWAYDPDTDSGSRITAEDTYHKATKLVQTSGTGAIARTTKTITRDFNSIFGVTPLYLLYVMWSALLGGASGSYGTHTNLYKVKITKA